MYIRQDITKSPQTLEKRKFFQYFPLSVPYQHQCQGGANLKLANTHGIHPLRTRQIPLLDTPGSIPSSCTTNSLGQARWGKNSCSFKKHYHK